MLWSTPTPTWGKIQKLSHTFFVLDPREEGTLISIEGIITLICIYSLFSQASRKPKMIILENYGVWPKGKEALNSISCFQEAQKKSWCSLKALLGPLSSINCCSNIVKVISKWLAKYKLLLYPKVLFLRKYTFKNKQILEVLTKQAISQTTCLTFQQLMDTQNFFA